MFPSNPWKDISNEGKIHLKKDVNVSFFACLAIDLISHQLLQVNAGHRLAAANALRHTFFEVYFRRFRFIPISFSIGLSIIL